MITVTVTVGLCAGLTAEKKGAPEVSFVFAVKASVNMQESEKYCRRGPIERLQILGYCETRYDVNLSTLKRLMAPPLVYNVCLRIV